MKKIIASSILMLCASLLTTAQAATRYSIEVLIFSRDNASIASEYWPDPVELPAQGIVLGQGAYQPRSSGTFFLKSTSRRISSQPGMRVLYHKAWSQPVIKGRNSQPISIAAGQRMVDGLYEIQGTITVDRGRYLHFKPNLQLRRYTADSLITATIDVPRRMRSKEAHYIDHPLMGIVVWAVPLEDN